MAATAGSEVSDGPVLSLINKRIRALRKKQNRIVQLEDSVAQGKVLNDDQKEVLRSKTAVSSLIDELEKLRQPLSVAVAEEVSLAVKVSAAPATKPAEGTTPPPPPSDEAAQQSGDSAAAQQSGEESDEKDQAAVEELLNLLYFGSLFDVKTPSDFTSIMFTRSHERECCLTYDTVTDEDTDLLAEKDLDLISSLSGLLISRPVDSSLSHKNALQRCIEHAKLWLNKSDQPIELNANVTYASLRERLSKIMASNYFTITPEMKAPVEMAAAAGGNFAQFQVRGVDVDVDSSFVQLQQQKDEETPNLQGHGSGENQLSPVEDVQKDEYETEIPAEVVSVQQEQVKPETEVEHNERDVEFEQHNGQRRNQRSGRGGGGGGRRGYSNGRGGRGRGSGPYQNGRNQFYDQPGNYYQRNYNRGRGGRGGGPSYNNNGSADQECHASANIGVAS